MSRNLTPTGLLADQLAANPLVIAAARFAPASAELRGERELLRRVDTKYVTTVPVALGLIDQLVDHYAALTVPSGNVAAYHSLYLDTPDRACFHDHRRGRRVRHKIRIRHYPDRDLTFLEIKTKRNEQLTIKHRLALPPGSETLDVAALTFLRDRIDLPVDSLLPTMRIGFWRISLVARAANERVTFDLGLTAENLDGGRWSFGDLVVIEIKQAPFCVRTPAMLAIAAAGLREQSMSKYTVSSAMMDPALRCNRLLPVVRAIARMTA